jgi:hypothetical protein
MEEYMKKIMMPVLLLSITAILQPTSYAQNPDKAAAEESARKQDKIAAEENARRPDRTGIPVKLQIVFSEYEGDKKIKSLPYTLSFNAMRSPDVPNQWAKLRAGSRVPAFTGKDQMTYIDVGTNIDSRAVRTDDGRYSVQLNIERSWVDNELAVPQKSANSPNASSDINPNPPREPVIRQFKSEFNNTVRDGETVETSLATDPLTGKVTKVQFTLTTVK